MGAVRSGGTDFIAATRPLRYTRWGLSRILAHFCLFKHGLLNEALEVTPEEVKRGPFRGWRWFEDAPAPSPVITKCCLQMTSHSMRGSGGGNIAVEPEAPVA
jgi:hypothetical protein